MSWKDILQELNYGFSIIPEVSDVYAQFRSRSTWNLIVVITTSTALVTKLKCSFVYKKTNKLDIGGT